MDIKIDTKEISISRPEEFGEKIISITDTNILDIFPDGFENDDNFLELEVKEIEPAFTKYILRSSRPILIKPRFSNSIELIIG